MFVQPNDEPRESKSRCVILAVRHCCLGVSNRCFSVLFVDPPTKEENMMALCSVSMRQRITRIEGKGAF